MSDHARPALGWPVFLAIGVVGTFWGLNWPTVKVLLSEIPPITVRAVSLSTAAALLGLALAVLGIRMRPRRDEIGALLLAGLLTVFGFNVLVSYGQTLTETSRAAIIAYAMPALTAMFSVWLLKERLDISRTIALVLAMGGIAVLAGEDLAGLVAEPLGPAIMFVSAISWALGIVATKARAWSIGPAAQAVWFLGASGLACWPLVLVFERPWDLPLPSTPVLWVLAWHILGPMLTCYALWTMLVGRMPASIAAIATLLAPVVAVGSSMALLGDPATVHKIAALALILASIALTFAWPVNRTRQR